MVHLCLKHWLTGLSLWPPWGSQGPARLQLQMLLVIWVPAQVAPLRILP